MSNEAVINKNHLLDYISILSIVFLIVLFTIINNNFLNIFNITNLLMDIGPLLVMGCGMTFVLLIGSIDLSVGSVCSCGAVILALLIPRIGNLAYLITLLFGLVAGLINGIIYTKIKIPSFIATLGTMSIWQSAAYLLSNGAPLQIGMANWKNIGWANINYSIFSVPLFLSLLVLLIMYIVQRFTAIGKSSYAIGANERASRLAGVKIDRTKIIVFTMCGICSALSGIFLAAKLRSGIPTVGDPFTLMSVAAVALGGTTLSGGKGGVFGTILGVALIIVIQNGMNVIGVDSFWQQIVFGLLVILALYFTIDRKGNDIIIK